MSLWNGLPVDGSSSSGKPTPIQVVYTSAPLSSQLARKLFFPNVPFDTNIQVKLDWPQLKMVSKIDTRTAIRIIL
jgi:hypothetical protein